MKRTFLVPAAVALLVAGCTFYLPDDDTAAVLFYNVENLFDAHEDGGEYPEYRPDAGWTEADYQDRLSRLGAALTAARPRPDVLFLAEVENRHVVEDLLTHHLPDLALAYYAFVRADGAATGIGVASRYPVLSINTLMASSGSTPPLRPSLEVWFDVAGEELVVIANHWKSKLGGAPATEPLRRAQAAIVASRVASITAARPGLPLLILGDFNEQPDELLRVDEGYATALLPAQWVAETTEVPESATSPAAAVVADTLDRGSPPGLLLATDAAGAVRLSSELPSAAGPVFVDPWAEIDDGGSYFYGGEWERIDAIYYSTGLADGVGLEVRGFRPLELEGALDTEGYPRSWTASDGGVSDHLPVVLEIGGVGE